VLAQLKFVQRAQSEEERDEQTAALFAIIPAKVRAYFETTWFCPRWAASWMDMDRPGWREGLWNTNNIVEAQFGKLGRFCNHKTSCSPSTTTYLLRSILQHYDILLDQHAQGLKHLPPSRSKLRLGVRVAAAHRILEEGKVDITLSPCRNLYWVGRYTVKISTWACSCLFFFKCGKMCKHAIAARMCHGLRAPASFEDEVPEGQSDGDEDNANSRDQDHNTTERSKGKEKLTSEESPDADTDADGDASADTDHAEANYTDLDRADATGDHTNADVDEEHSEEINTKDHARGRPRRTLIAAAVEAYLEAESPPAASSSSSSSKPKRVARRARSSNGSMTFNHPAQAEEQTSYMNRRVSAGRKKKTAPRPSSRKTARQRMNDAVDDALATAVAQRNHHSDSNPTSTDEEETCTRSAAAARRRKDARRSADMYATSPRHTPRKEKRSDAPPKDPKRKPKRNPLQAEQRT